MSITMGQLASNFAAAAAQSPGNMEKKIAVIAQLGVGHVKKSIQKVRAVDTGTMLNSTTVDKLGPTTYLVGPTVDYAVYVQYGTSRMAARDFLTPAAKALVRDVKKLGDDWLKVP